MLATWAFLPRNCEDHLSVIMTWQPTCTPAPTIRCSLCSYGQPWVSSSEQLGCVSVVPHLRALPADRASLTPTCRYQDWPTGPPPKAFTPEMMGELITLRFIYLISHWEKRFDSTRIRTFPLPKSCWPVQNYLWFILHFKHYLKPQQGEKENMTAVCGKQALGCRLIRTSPLDNHLENHKKGTQCAETVYLLYLSIFWGTNSDTKEVPWRPRLGVSSLDYMFWKRKRTI